MKAPGAALPPRIVSGGQTGVDRGALDATLELGVDCGGWCPEGRLAEDGRIADRYPLVELAGAGYLERTERNVLDSDATLIVYGKDLEGGTAETLRLCRQHAKPCLLIRADRTSVASAAAELRRFLQGRAIRVLNVAGPRASKWPGAQEYAYNVIRELYRHDIA